MFVGGRALDVDERLKLVFFSSGGGWHGLGCLLTMKVAFHVNRRRRSERKKHRKVRADVFLWF